jgi:hypothetical protein
MASGLLITAVLVFAVRGMFLGLTGVIGRFIGFILAYIAAYSFRHQLAAFVSTNTSITLPTTILEVICGIALFVVTMFITGLIIKAAFKLIGKVIPGFTAIADQDSWGGKITGATLNGLIGAAIVLIGIWGYGKVTGKIDPNDELQQFANSFGDKAFNFVSDNTDLSIQSFSSSSFSSSSITTSSKPTSSRPSKSVSTSNGSATIVSSSNPEKSLSIESIRQIIEEVQPSEDGSGVSFSSSQIQGLLENSEIRDQALQMLQDNPEQLEKVMNNPKLMELLEKFQTSAP